MATMLKVVVVTGSNKGIGRGIVEALCRLLPSEKWIVYLTARNTQLGQVTLEEMKASGLTNVAFHQLDIDCADSRHALRDYLHDKYGGIDVLINNAAIAFKGDSVVPFAEQAEVTLRTDFFNTLSMCREFMPLLRQDARLVNVSSMMSEKTLQKLGSALHQRLVGPMSMEELEQCMRQFVSSAADGTLSQHGWVEQAYGVAKIGVTKMTAILAEEMRQDARNILINCCCPGYVDTDMTSHRGHLTIHEGADTPVYLATLPTTMVDPPRGLFFSKRQPLLWQ